MSRVRAIGLAGALLALGCGGASTSADGGGSSSDSRSGIGSDASGAAGEGGAPTANGAAGAGFCTDFEPCGGDLVGTWQAAPLCTSPIIASPPGQGCPGESWDASGVALSATVTFSSAGAATFSYSSSGRVVLKTPTSCLVANGMQLECTDTSAGTMYRQLAFTGGKVDSTACAPTTGGLCTCTYELVAAPISASGAYMVTGTQLETFLGSEVDDFCVMGTTLKLHNSDPLASPPAAVQVYARQ